MDNGAVDEMWEACLAEVFRCLVPVPEDEEGTPGVFDEEANILQGSVPVLFVVGPGRQVQDDQQDVSPCGPDVSAGPVPPAGFGGVPFHLVGPSKGG